MGYIAYARFYSDTELKEMEHKLMSYASENNITYFNSKTYCEKYRAIKEDGSHKPILSMLKNMLTEFTGMDAEELCMVVPELTCLGNNNAELIEELLWFRENHVQIVSLDVAVLVTSRKLQLLNNTVVDAIVDSLRSLNKRDDKRIHYVREEGRKHKAAGQAWGRPKALSKADFDKVYDRVRVGEISPTQAIEVLRTNKGTYYRYKLERDRELGLSG